MSGQSLGLIETVGLAVAVEAADAALKSANVELTGYELSKGGGLVTVKLTGEVGAINAAVAAGVASASKIGEVFAWKVIARTASGIDNMLKSEENHGPEKQEPAVVPEDNESLISVRNLEPDVETSSCLTLAEERPSDAPEALSLALAEEKSADSEPGENKATRPRAKNTRR